eukprot:1152901-Pelagomonas_calceolata.AAC.14
MPMNSSPEHKRAWDQIGAVHCWFSCSGLTAHLCIGQELIGKRLLWGVWVGITIVSLDASYKVTTAYYLSLASGNNSGCAACSPSLLRLQHFIHPHKEFVAGGSSLQLLGSIRSIAGPKHL